MAKKAKPAKADAGKKASKQEKDTSNEQHTVKSGLMGIMLPAIAGSALVTAICGALLLFLVIMPGADQQMAILGKAQATNYLNDLTT